MIARKLTTLAQVALLSEEEFKRMLPDFVVWFGYSKGAQKPGKSRIYVSQRTEGRRFRWLHRVASNDSVVGSSIAVGAKPGRSGATA